MVLTALSVIISHYQSLQLFLWAWTVRAGESAHLGTVLHTFARGYRVEGVDIIRNSRYLWRDARRDSLLILHKEERLPVFMSGN